jgi:hypothetical protein
MHNTPLNVSDLLFDNHRFHEKRITDVQHIQPKSIIRQYDENGNLLGEYASINQASKETGVGFSSIQKCLAGQRKRAGKYFWSREMFGSSPAGIGTIINDLETRDSQINSGLSKPVIQIDPATGELIAIHSSISTAAKIVGIDKKGISDVLRHKQKTAGGYTWQLYEFIKDDHMK